MIDRTMQNGGKMLPRLRLAAVLAATTLMLSATGCSNSPSFNILGSYFPAWILCCALAGALTFGVHSLFIRWKITQEIWALPLAYTALFSFFSCILWLIFFN